MMEENREEKEEIREEKTMPGTALTWLKQILLVILLTLVISVLVVQTYDINDVSMEPTFDPRGNRVLVFLAPYHLDHVPDHEDIVIIDSRVERKRTFLDKFLDSPLVSIIRGEQNEHLWVKRVIGLPGDKLEYEDGNVIRNGQVLEEDYVKGEMQSGFQSLEVPEDHIFVMGDNRNSSSDSRSIGPIPTENIQGRVILRFFPFDKITTY